MSSGTLHHYFAPFQARYASLPHCELFQSWNLESSESKLESNEKSLGDPTRRNAMGNSLQKVKKSFTSWQLSALHANCCAIVKGHVMFLNAQCRALDETHSDLHHVCGSLGSRISHICFSDTFQDPVSGEVCLVPLHLCLKQLCPL